MSDDEMRKQAAEAARGARTSIAQSGLQGREQGTDVGADQQPKPFDHGLTPVSPITPQPAPAAPSPSPTQNDPDRG